MSLAPDLSGAVDAAVFARGRRGGLVARLPPSARWSCFCIPPVTSAHRPTTTRASHWSPRPRCGGRIPAPERTRDGPRGDGSMAPPVERSECKSRTIATPNSDRSGSALANVTLRTFAAYVLELPLQVADVRPRVGQVRGPFFGQLGTHLGLEFPDPLPRFGCRATFRITFVSPNTTVHRARRRRTGRSRGCGRYRTRRRSSGHCVGHRSGRTRRTRRAVRCARDPLPALAPGPGAFGTVRVLLRAATVRRAPTDRSFVHSTTLLAERSFATILFRTQTIVRGGVRVERAQVTSRYADRSRLRVRYTTTESHGNPAPHGPRRQRARSRRSAPAHQECVRVRRSPPTFRCRSR